MPSIEHSVLMSLGVRHYFISMVYGLMDYLWESRLSIFVCSLPSSEKIKILYLSSRTSEPRDVERLTDK